jgi:phosphate starvation-inducible PhoH-like protein
MDPKANAESTLRIAIPDDGVEALFGSYDENLRFIESLARVRLSTQGQDLLVAGDAAGVARVEHLVGKLLVLQKGGYRLSNGDVKTAAELLMQDPSADLREYFLKSTLRPSGGRRVVTAKSVNQKKYIEAIDRFDIVFGIGPAERVNRIVLARPAVEAGEKLGFLPGDLQEKVNPYLRPLYDALYDMMDDERAERLVERGTIEIAPLAFMRGRTLNDAFVILDEAQNTTSEQMKMFLTRLGFGSKAVVTGDITQIDLPAGKTSGLIEAIKVVGHVEGVEFVYFDERDVVRHKLVQLIVRAYEAYGTAGPAAGGARRPE